MLLRVPGDVEQASVVHAVVFGAQPDQVVGGGGTAVLPMHDVMDLDAAGGTAGHPAAPIPQLDGLAQGEGDDVAAPADVEGPAVADPDDDPGGVTQDQPAQGVGQGGAVVEVGAADLDVDHRPVGVSPGGAVDGVQGALGHLDQGVGSGDVGISGPEQGVSGFGQRRGHDGALVGFQAGPQPPPTMSVVPARHPAGVRFGLYRILGRFGVELVAGQAAPQLRDGGQAGQVGRLGLAVGGDVAGHDHDLIHRPTLPPRTRSWWRAAHLWRRPGPPASRARPGDRPVFQATHWVSVKIPAPSQQRDANTSATRDTRRAWAAFNWPHTSLRAASISATSIRTSVRTGVLQSFAFSSQRDQRRRGDPGRYCFAPRSGGNWLASPAAATW